MLSFFQAAPGKAPKEARYRLALEVQPPVLPVHGLVDSMPLGFPTDFGCKLG